MSSAYDSFVVFAEMRTGSNFLEANLNAFDGITCHGEAFNSNFIGYPNRDNILGVSQPERDADPHYLLKVIRENTEVLGGFRYFHNHDPRVLSALLEDKRCAKIILTRNPVDSYVSWKIAQSTGQWKLTNVRKRKDGQAVFDQDEFENHLSQLQDFQIELLNRLQVSGQTAFYVGYEDLQSVDVMNGLVAWLGVDAKLDSLNKNLKRQNPEPVSEKVANFEDMQNALARLDRFNLTRTPNFEPRRGPVVPSYVTAAKTPLIYMPIRSGPEDAVLNWMAALDNASRDDLATKYNQRTMRDWKETRPGHRSFTVLRHPLARAHAVFCNHILHTGPGSMVQIRKTLRRAHDLPVPEDGPDESYDQQAHREAFTVFLRFVRANLLGQTGVRVDAHWASQANCLQGMSDYTLPDMVIREDEMVAYLPALAMQVGHLSPPDPEPVATRAPYSLAEIYDGELEALAQEAYERDYMMFGFAEWG